jgi:hypothetical protein
MKFLRFILFLALSLVMIGVAYWLLSMLFPWFMGLSGFWFFFLLFVFASFAYRFFFTNLALFRLRKTVLMFLGNSPLNWTRAFILIFYSLFGFVYVFNSYALKTEHSTWDFIAYWVFVLLILQLTINMMFQLLSSGDN